MPPFRTILSLRDALLAAVVTVGYLNSFKPNIVQNRKVMEPTFHNLTGMPLYLPPLFSYSY
jgi:hypothetical protein